MKSIATYAYKTWARGLFLIYFLALGGCTLPRTGSAPEVYDFGPGALQTEPDSHNDHLPPLELSTPQASAALNSIAVQYRLAYTDAQQLKPYTLARWSMPPAQLLDQRLRAQLGLHRAVIAPGEIIGAASALKAEPLLNLRLELEEFSQLFETPVKSSGLLRLRATVTQRSSAGDALLAQRSFIVQQPAPTPDASGGVHALSAATDQAIAEIEVWLAQLAPHHPAQ